MNSSCFVIEESQKLYRMKPTPGEKPSLNTTHTLTGRNSIMKKSLIALAVLGAAASAQAADISLYGVVDTGLAYTYEDNWGFNDQGLIAHTTDGESNLEMASGINASSRWGITGSEDLGNGMKVGFKLESAINTDDGSLGQGDRLFGREASLTLSGDFGKISAGRMGGVGSSAGTYDYVYLIGEAFDGGDFNIWGMTASSRYDNMITYETPEFAGVKVTAQYSFDGDVNGDNNDYLDDAQHGKEGKTSVDRYASLAVTGGYGNLQFVGAYEYFNHASNSAVKDDGHLFHLGGNYDFGVTKVFALAQYYQGVRKAAGWNLADDIIDGLDYELIAGEGTDGFKGYGLHLGSITPIGGGDLTVAAYFQDGKLENNYMRDVAESFDLDAQYVGVSARYAYHLSKRTDAYLGAGYAKATLETGSLGGDVHDMEKELIQAYVGLTHRF